MGSIATDRQSKVVIGVDPHPGSHTFSAVDSNGGVLGELRIENTVAGREALWAWADRFPDRRWAVEGPGNRYAKGLVSELILAGEQLHAVAPAMTAEYRKRYRRGKDDEIDAGSAARSVLANDDVPVYFPTEYEGELKELTRTYQRLVVQCKSTKMAHDQLENREVREVLRGVIDVLSDAIQELKRKIHHMVKETAPDLLRAMGVGPIVAGTLLAETGRVDRFGTPAQFAAYSGCAPISWDSGAHQAHRVNPGGNRRLNWAMHIVVMSRLRIDQRTQAFRDRKLREGKTQREVLRILKTYVSRELFRLLKACNPDSVTT